MLHDVVSAIYKGGYRIELEFDDGQRGTVDFAKYLKRRGVFERFRSCLKIQVYIPCAKKKA